MFVDTIRDAASSTVTLPKEAMSYNGVYLENEIRGYQTLHVSGRELLASEAWEERIDGQDGSRLFGKTYPPRIITVTYQLIADNATAFREAYNQMNRYLSGKEVEVLFADEPDKYFVGTKMGGEAPEPGSNQVIGTFEIYCADPFKYSKVRKQVKASVNNQGILEAEIVNEGNRPAVLDYEIINHQESGYIGIVSDGGAMQFGKVEEQDGQDLKLNETLVNFQDLINAPNDPAGPDYLHNDPSRYVVGGKLATTTWFNHIYLRMSEPGDTSIASNGGGRTITIPADSSGAVGAKNWYSYFHLCFWAGQMGQTGEMSLAFLTEDNKLIAGVNWFKTDSVGNTGHYEFWANGKSLALYTYTTNHLHTQNPWYSDWGHCDLRKEGAKLTFYYWGNYPSYVIPEVENMVCTKIQLSIKQYGTRGGDRFMSMVGFDNFRFTKIGVDSWKDAPNRYPAGSKLTIDGLSSSFSVNGMPKPGDEVLGTTYFKAQPGTSKVQFYPSTWVTQNPDITVFIREAWL